MDLRQQVLEFLYSQVSQNKIPQIKKGMVEDLEQFVQHLLASAETSKIASRALEKAEQADEKDSE